MATFDETGTTTRTAREIGASIVARMAADPDLAGLVVAGNAEAALVSVIAAEFEAVEHGFAMIPAALIYSLQAGGTLRTTSRALFNLSPREASRSRYPVGATSTGGVVPLEAGTRITGGGVTGYADWVVVDRVEVGPTRTTVTIEAVDDGPVGLDPLGVDLQIAEPVAGIASVSHLAATDGDGQIGRAAAGDAEIVALIRDLLNQPARAQLYAAIRSLSWVDAVSVETPAAGTIEVLIAPAPLGTDQADALAAAILDNAAPGTLFTGTGGTGDATEPSGEIVAVPYSIATTEAVDVTVTATVPAGTDTAALEAGIEAAIRATFASLQRDHVLRFAALYSDAWAVVANVATAYAVTAPAADVTPSAARLLVPGTLSITVST